MQHLLEATKKALSDENWYAALTLALNLPDICGRLENPKRKSQERYEAWYSRFVEHVFNFKFSEETHCFLTAADCYALRCAFLHQGEFEIEDQRAREVLTRITFRAPHPDDFTHLVSNGKILHLKADMFCTAVCDGVADWTFAVRTDQEIQERIRRMGRIALPGGIGYY